MKVYNFKNLRKTSIGMAFIIIDIN